MVFDQAILRELVAMKDELGVLSLFATADPREEAAARPAWDIRLRNELTAIREHVATWPDRERRQLVLDAMESLELDIRELIDPRVPGIGRAMFAPLSGGEVRKVSLQLPMGDKAMLESTAYLRPLVSAVATSTPAGVVVVSRDGLRLVDYRQGVAEDISRVTFELDTDDWRTMRGPGSPAVSQQVANQVDKFHRRIDDNLNRFLHTQAPQVAERAGKLGWTDVLLVGDARLTETLAAALHPMHVVQVDTIIDNLPAGEVVRHVSDQLAEARARRDQALVSRVKDAALSGGRGVLGLNQTLALLNEGRVERLLLDESGQWRGGSGPDGYLYGAGETPDGVEVIDEPDLGERMIERALESSAEVTILTGEAAADLADYNGVAALLRW
ncbi:VLRF1 family aeRF1-type release factor [Nonomuraea sediminis]|uniref:VLRF1 family aeRF1-type release factor n=1 Tax=Nonomuraea sediminis TaxID=2835864 RepID=UPI001BDC76EB|nr:VLRF1 family aeRF1-type release factor [Nonomuraea sediminis]